MSIIGMLFRSFSVSARLSASNIGRARISFCFSPASASASPLKTLGALHSLSPLLKLFLCRHLHLSQREEAAEATRTTRTNSNDPATSLFVLLVVRQTTATLFALCAFSTSKSKLDNHLNGSKKNLISLSPQKSSRSIQCGTLIRNFFCSNTQSEQS
jgi:hypothetical protein